jgi:hypothetical protein
MKLSEFIVLPQEQKRFTVLQEGVPIAQRLVSNHMVFLFQLPHFYVETYCSTESKVIEEYRAFYKPEHLQPYLEAIHISD